MKSAFITFVMILTASVGYANENKEETLLDCLATQIYDSSEFEESFSVQDYPDFRIFKINEKMAAEIGARGADVDGEDGRTVSFVRKNRSEAQLEIRRNEPGVFDYFYELDLKESGGKLKRTLRWSSNVLNVDKKAIARIHCALK